MTKSEITNQQNFIKKFKKRQFSKLSEKEIDDFVVGWEFRLRSHGYHLSFLCLESLTVKRDYIINNQNVFGKVIAEFPEYEDDE